VLVLDKGNHLGTKPGRILRGKGYKAAASSGAAVLLKVVGERGNPVSARVRLFDRRGARLEKVPADLLTASQKTELLDFCRKARERYQ
jgi:hypothetical protein